MAARSYTFRCRFIRKKNSADIMLYFRRRFPVINFVGIYTGANVSVFPPIVHEPHTRQNKQLAFSVSLEKRGNNISGKLIKHTYICRAFFLRINDINRAYIQISRILCTFAQDECAVPRNQEAHARWEKQTSRSITSLLVVLDY